MEIIIKFEPNDLVGSGPFKITYGGYIQDPGGYNEFHYTGTSQNEPPLVASIPKWQLLNGYTYSVPPALYGLFRIRVSELPPCTSFVDIDILSEPEDVITEDSPTLNINIVGSAVVGGGLYTMTRYDIYKYTITETFDNGNAQFEIDGILYSEDSFPNSTNGASENGPPIPVVAGNYNVILDVETAQYSFIAV
jgi:hypothetical protein